jgi:hypothetical protein
MVEEPWTVFLGLSTEGLGDNDRRDLADRLTLSGVERKVLYPMRRARPGGAEAPQKKGGVDGALHAALQGLRAETRASSRAGATPTGKRSLLRYEKDPRFLEAPFGSGKDLIDFGRRPGPEFAALLRKPAPPVGRRLRTRDQAFPLVGIARPGKSQS